MRIWLLKKKSNIAVSYLDPSALHDAEKGGSWICWISLFSRSRHTPQIWKSGSGRKRVSKSLGKHLIEMKTTSHNKTTVLWSCVLVTKCMVFWHAKNSVIPSLYYSKQRYRRWHEGNNNKINFGYDLSTSRVRCGWGPVIYASGYSYAVLWWWCKHLCNCGCVCLRKTIL